MSETAIHVHNSQSDMKVDEKKVEALIQGLLKYRKITCHEVSCYLVDSKTIKELHAEFFDDPTVTDTITFPVDRHDDERIDYCVLGDMFVCPKVALDYTTEKGGKAYTELSLYIIHSFLHLTGLQDQTTEQKRKMRTAERSCLNFLEKNQLMLACESETTYTKSKQPSLKK